MEIKKRCEMLMRLIRKEFEEHQKEANEPMNATTMSDAPLKPKDIGKRRATIETGAAKKKKSLAPPNE